MSSDGGKRKRQEDDGELVGADSSNDDMRQKKIEEIKTKRKVQNKIRCQRYRDKKKTDAIVNSQISKHRAITVEEEEKIKRRKEQRKQNSQRYRDKKRDTNLINLQTDQSSKRVVKHLPKCQNFHNSQIADPSTRNVPYVPPTRDKKKTDAIVNSQIYKHRAITVEEEEKIKRREEQRKRNSQRYRDKKRATNLINLQTDQSSKRVVKHLPKCQNFHNSQIADPSTRNVPYVPPTHTAGLSTRNETYSDYILPQPAMMKHEASELVEEQSGMRMTIKTEVEEAAQSPEYVEIEVDMKFIKEDPELAEHMKTEPGISLKEDVCQTIDDSQHSNKATQPEQRPQSQLFRCDKCAKTFNSKVYFRQHSRYGHSTESHKCTECNKEFPMKSYLYKHISNVHSKQQYDCAICKKVCKSKLALTAHIFRVHRLRPSGSQLRICICDYCRKTFTSKTSLVCHMTCVHASGSYKCSQCNKSFKCKQYLVTHTAYMHSASMQACNVCGEDVRSHYLRQHMRNMHSDKQLQCKLCGKTMKSKQYLLQHLNRFHDQQSAVSPPVVYTCDYCQMTYPRKDTLVSHIEGVHGKSSHRCSECKKEFKCKRYLQSHIKIVHSKGEHECEFCKKLFRNKQYYNRHVRLHCKKSAGTSGHSESHQQSTCSNFGKDLKHEEISKGTHPPVGDLNAVPSTSTPQRNVVAVKEEPADRELELGPVVFQHMDCKY